MKWRVMWYKQKPDCFYARWVRYFDRHFQARDFAAVTNKFWPERCATVEEIGEECSDPLVPSRKAFAGYSHDALPTLLQEQS